MRNKIIVVFFALAFLSACGGGGGNGNDPTEAPIGEVGGTWSVSENVDGTACGDGIYVDSYSLAVTQSGNSVTVTDDTGSYNGTLEGNRLSWSGSFPEDGGIVQATVSLAIAADCNSLSGSANWTWSDGITACSGTTQVSATRDNPTGCGGSAGTLPAAPDGLVATATSSSSIDLSWSDNSSDETNYVLQRSTMAGFGFLTIATLAANSTSYSDITGLSASTTYYYQVYATNGTGNSGFSNEAMATTSPAATTVPVAPNGLIATATSSNSVDLSWADNSSDETNFVVQVSTTSGTGFVTVATLGANITDYTDLSGLTASTTYFYQVYATNAFGNSGLSNEAMATTNSPVNTAPDTPDGLAASGISEASITLIWNDVSNEQSYVLQRSLTGGSGFTTIATLAADTTSYTDTGLISSTTYYYRIRAVNIIGNSNFSSETIATTTTAAISPPNAPSGLNAVATSSSTINLSWVDNSSNETAFVVQRSTSSSSSFVTIATILANTTIYTNDGLESSTTYYYRVHANNSSGNSSFTADNATTQAPPVSLPSAPSNLVATVGSSSEIILNWTDTSLNNDGFIIERSTSSTTGFVNIATIGDSTTYLATGLGPSTTYYFRVKAYNSAGDSGYSNIDNATTLANLINYSFPGGNLSDLEAVSANLTFNNLTINGTLNIPSSESSVVFNVANFALNAVTGFGIAIDYPDCSYLNAPNITINATGAVTLNDSIDTSGKNGTNVASGASCLSPGGTDGGNVTINASTVSVNGTINTDGGNSGNESSFIGGTLFRFGYNGADAGNITLNATNSLALTASANLSSEGGSGGFSTPGADGTPGIDGSLSWTGTPITVAEIDGLNALTYNGQLIPYTPLTINGTVGSADDSIYRNSTTSGWCQITYTSGFIDFVEDWYQVRRTTLGTIEATSSSTSDIDIFLLGSCGGSIISQGNGATGNETFTSPLLAPGIYLLGVSYADDAPPGSTSYTVTLGN